MKQQQQEAPRLQRMIRLSELPLYVGIKRTVIGELITRGEFPKPVPISDSGRAVAWLETDIITWQNSRIAKRNSVAA
ncbi:MAG: AlpA family phage regulatory protein [Pseudolabrys sp.]